MNRMNEKPVIVVSDENAFTNEELVDILEGMKERVATEKYIGPGPSIDELKLKAKNRIKNKLARKARRVTRKRRK